MANRQELYRSLPGQVITIFMEMLLNSFDYKNLKTILQAENSHFHYF